MQNHAESVSGKKNLVLDFIAEISPGYCMSPFQGFYAFGRSWSCAPSSHHTLP